MGKYAENLNLGKRFLPPLGLVWLDMAPPNDKPLRYDKFEVEREGITVRRSAENWQRTQEKSST